MSTTTPVLRALDPILSSEGFTRRGQRWNRRSGLFVDVIHAQVAKAGNTFTINLGTADPEVFERSNGSPLPNPVNDFHCTVTTRLGFLTTGRDAWWELGDQDAPMDVATKMRSHGLPWLDGMHSREAIERYLTEHLSGLFPYEVIYLAVLRQMLGRLDEACAVLAERQPRLLGDWPSTFAKLRAEMGCPEDGPGRR